MTPAQHPSSSELPTGATSLLGAPGLRRLLAQLKRRYQRGLTTPAGTISLRGVSADERRAIDALLGRGVSTGDPLVIRLEVLDQVIRHAGCAGGLHEAVLRITGPIENRTDQAQKLRQAWEALYASAGQRVAGDGPAQPWLDELRKSGLLKRLSGADLALARRLLDNALCIVGSLPHRGTTLAALSAATTGDAHALDRGQPLATLLGGLLAEMSGVGPLRSAARFRRAWDRLGVACDQLSASVLVLNLPAEDAGVTGSMLRAASAAGEPCRLTVRQLMRHPPRFAAGALQRIFVCENPSILAAAADLHGPKALPLVCTEGQPTTAVRILLQQLIEAGGRLLYHGDFDWPGIGIANQILATFAASPWRMSAHDYRAAAAGAALPLSGRTVAPVWDAELGEAMGQLGRAVHEEQVLEHLLADLAG